MDKRNISSSIAFKLAIVFILFAVFQSILLASLMIKGGVLEQARSNQYSFFSEKVNGRSNNLENQMKNIWTNLDYDTEQISRYMQTFGDRIPMEKADQVLEQMAPLVLDALTHSKTTGAFLVIPDPSGQQDESLAALYFRNNNPDRNSKENSNLYMLIGPWNVAEKMKIATTANWSFRLDVNEDNRDFIYKPYEAAGETGRSAWLGYWSPPFKVNPQDEDIITYSLPLFGSDGEVKAIFGVEIAVSYLYHFLPASDLQAADSYGYIIGVKDEDGDVWPAVTYGAMQGRMLKKDQPLDFRRVDDEGSIYRLLNHNSAEDIYACVNPMGMYYHNTPFEGEEWSLIGLIEKPDLLRFPDRIGRILGYSFLLSLVIGFITAIITSQWFTRHAKLIELSGLPVGAFEISERTGRVFMTTQIPRLLNLTKEQERTFCRNKNLFVSYLKNLRPAEAGEEGVFCMEAEGCLRWIKITCKTSESPLRYVVEDVTEEVLHTKALKKERDRDGLTGVKNRRAFGNALEQANRCMDGQQRIGLIMCDLNDLKGVNDAFGHDKGDEYIRYAADSICEAFPDGEVFRIGGDEFAVLLQNVSADEVRKSILVLEDRIAARGNECSYVPSIAAGYAFYDADTDKGLENTLSRADADMYEKKRKMKIADAMP